MVEAHANSVEDKLIDGLSFKLSPGASYIQERKSVTFHPQGSNIYSTNGTKLIKLLVSGDSWMDPSTFRVMFDLVNMDSDAAKELRPLGGPSSFFRRMRVLCGGQVVEDIDNYNRVHQIFHSLQQKIVQKMLMLKHLEKHGISEIIAKQHTLQLHSQASKVDNPKQFCLNHYQGYLINLNIYQSDIVL